MRLDPGVAGRVGERPGDRALGVLEVRPGADGVDQVVGDVDAGHRRGQGVGVGGVADGDLDVVEPGQVAQPLGVPGQDADPMARGQQLGHEPAADVAGGAGDQAEPAGAWGPWRQCAGPRRRRKSAGPWLGASSDLRRAPPPTGARTRASAACRPRRSPSAGPGRAPRLRARRTRPSAARAARGSAAPAAPARALATIRTYDGLAGHRLDAGEGRPAEHHVVGSRGRCPCRCRPRSRSGGSPRGPRCRTTGMSRRPSSSPGTGWPRAGSRRCARTRRRPDGSRIRVTRSATSSTVPDRPGRRRPGRRRRTGPRRS